LLLVILKKYKKEATDIYIYIQLFDEE